METYIVLMEMTQKGLDEIEKVPDFVDTFENRFSAIDEANTRIYNALNKANISIPFPQIDIHLKK